MSKVRRMSPKKVGKLCTSCYKIHEFIRCLNCDVSSLRCNTCFNIYKSFDEFKSHLRTADADHSASPQRVHKSNTRRKAEPTVGVVTALATFGHRLTATVYVCSVCHIVFSNMKRSLIHVTRIHSKEKYECDKCGRTYRKKDSLYRHSISHKRDPSFMCDICKKCYYTYHSLKYHILRHLNFQNYKCQLCEKTFNEPNSLARHVQHHSEEKNFKCKLCDKSFCYTFTLRRHFQEMHSELPTFACDICGVVCKRKADISRHIKKHMNLKGHECPICKKTFSRKSTAAIHQLMHSEAKMYLCFCGKTFKYQSSLTRHQDANHKTVD